MFGKLMPYVLAACAATIIGLAGALYLQSGKLETAQANLRAAQFGVDACAEANKSQGDSLEQMQAAQVKNRTDLIAAQIAVSTLAVSMGEWRERALTAETDEEQLRRTVYADDPECARWGDALVCPGIADRLRQAAGQGRYPH